MISPWLVSHSFASRCGRMTRLGLVMLGSGRGATALISPYFSRSSSIGPQSSAREGQAVTQAGSSPLRTQVGAQVALVHLLGLRVELRRGVRAGPLAVAATNALIGVDGDDAVLPLVHRGRRADLRADQVLAVIAGDRCVVGEGLVVKHPVGEVPVPAGVLHDPAPVGTQRGVVLVLAGDLAGLAADAQALVEVETQPLVFLGSVLLSHVFLTFGLS